MEDKKFMAPEDVAGDLGISLEEANQLVNQMVLHLKGAGYLTVAHRIQKSYYNKQKEAGFMMARREIERETPIRLDEKRLLSLAEFCTYASIGRDKGMEMAEAARAVFRAGKRVMIDRVKFDRWCDEQQ